MVWFLLTLHCMDHVTLQHRGEDRTREILQEPDHPVTQGWHIQLLQVWNTHLQFRRLLSYSLSIPKNLDRLFYYSPFLLQTVLIQSIVCWFCWKKRKKNPHQRRPAAGCPDLLHSYYGTHWDCLYLQTDIHNKKHEWMISTVSKKNQKKTSSSKFSHVLVKISGVNNCSCYLHSARRKSDNKIRLRLFQVRVTWKLYGFYL